MSTSGKQDGLIDKGTLSQDLGSKVKGESKVQKVVIWPLHIYYDIHTLYNNNNKIIIVIFYKKVHVSMWSLSYSFQGYQDLIPDLYPQYIL
jgi:hypothetical protein